ncbi:NUMOD4 domain-containing protein [Paenibacillus tianjinensis]|uniref:HNH endonuclease n=1 Tax=Paenibacillus tianjinensis TaxID=2810347 RepID=A0ABX7LAR7_9BACL|nr:NUMOD4 domain-containing protein [Paenibacillus tianjinensis]QSF43540.1 HNH endonuclease [Paenibacillus tianjinensis]
MEIWKDIEGFEGYYQVSTHGRIRSLDRVIDSGRRFKGKIITPSYDTQGYVTVHLYKNGKDKTCRAHRLVALAFIANPDNKPEVNHLDEIRNNNRIENLQWCTPLENSNYGNRKLRISQNTDYVTIAKKCKKAVNQYTLNGDFLRTWDSARDVQKETGIQQSAIRLNVNGQYSSAGGFIWQDANTQSSSATPYKTKRNRRVYQYDLSGNFIKEWNMIKDIYNELGLNKKRISMCMNGEIESFEGFIWKDSEVQNG